MKYKWIIALFIVLATIISCEDILEVDISKDPVILLAPTDSLTTEAFTHTFWWDFVDGASSYQLQIVTPTFDAPAALVLDSITSSNKMTVTLNEGHHQWAVRALNNGYATDFFIQDLFIESTQDLSQQVVNLSSPLNNSVTNDTSIVFNWEAISIADEYKFELLSGTVFDTVTTEASVQRSFERMDATYTWKVTAMNEISSKDSETYSFSIDITGPAAPTLIEPKADSIFTALPVGLTWERVEMDISEDSVFIFSDALGTNILSGYPKAATEAMLTIDAGLSSGDHYWSVLSVDQAGNQGEMSVIRKFSIQ